MKKFLSALLLLAAPAFAAGVTVTGNLPTMLANGDAYAPAAGDTISIYKNTVLTSTHVVTAAEVTSGMFSEAETTAARCLKDSWVATYTSLASGLTSAGSAPVTTSVSATGCVVNFAPGLSVK